MSKKIPNNPRAPGPGELTRRQVLAGAATVAFATSTPFAMAAPNRRKPKRKPKEAQPTGQPIRRYMAAAASLEDGRVLICGGYDRPWIGDSPPPALVTAMIYDPATGSAWHVAPMHVPRARHAAVTLKDGRIAVVGGLGLNPTASVEIYDPTSGRWRLAGSLRQARFDHMAVSNGNDICVLGGSGLGMLSSVEVYSVQDA